MEKLTHICIIGSERVKYILYISPKPVGGIAIPTMHACTEKEHLTLSLPDMRICVNFSTVYNDTLVAKGLNNDDID